MTDDMKIEMEAGRKIQLDHLNEFITNPQDCESIYVEALKRGNKDLVEKNARLQEQLNKEIHYNRKMKSALEKYADPFNDMQPINELARQVLKEIDNKE